MEKRLRLTEGEDVCGVSILVSRQPTCLPNTKIIKSKYNEKGAENWGLRNNLCYACTHL